MTKFKTQWDPTYKGTSFVNDYGPKQTVPSMTLTVQELMQRHTRGLGTDAVEREPIYLEEGDEIPVIRDLTDIVERREQLEAKQHELEQQLQAQRIARTNQQTAAKKAPTTSDQTSGDEPPKNSDNPK